jgi:4-amino-4-deoxy-L-arabinose transferase-like glycosyltransferase
MFKDFYQKFSDKNKFYLLFSSIIFIFALALRSTALNQPPHDAHPMRQTDTACVIHFFKTQSFNILQPRTCLIRPPTNNKGLFFLELPFYQWLVAGFQRVANTDAWWTVRAINLTLFAAAFWMLYFGIARHFNKKLAVFAVFIFSFIPSGLFFFGQAVHPDVFMIAALFASWNFLTLYLKTNRKLHLFLYLLSLNFLIATRPFAALAIVPFSLMIWQNKQKRQAILSAVFSFMMLVFWKAWQSQFPLADHTWQTWVFDGRKQLLQLDTIKHLVFKNLTGEVVGKAVSGLTLAGLVVFFKSKKRQKLLPFLVYLLLVPVYWIIVPAGNIAHQYYAHVVIFPFIIISAYFLDWLSFKLQNQYLKVFMLGLILLLVAANGYRTSRYFFITRISNEELQMAEQISKTIPASAKIIYLGQSSLPMSLAYRQGWTIAQPPADLSRNAKSVKAVFHQADFVIVPFFDDSFPEKEKNLVIDELELIAATELGEIYSLDK